MIMNSHELHGIICAFASYKESQFLCETAYHVERNLTQNLKLWETREKLSRIYDVASNGTNRNIACDYFSRVIIALSFAFISKRFEISIKIREEVEIFSCFLRLRAAWVIKSRDCESHYILTFAISFYCKLFFRYH